MNAVTRKLAAAAALVAFPVLVAGAPVPSLDSTLTFDYTQSQSTESSQTASGGSGTIGFTGSLTTATPCYQLTAAHRQGGNRVTLTVTATQQGDICTQVITYNNYEGQVSGLAAGTYRFVVIHQMGNDRQTVYDEQVTVS
jgi:hypothetical protein